MEKLEILEATTKQSGNKKGDKDKSEDKTGKSKSKTKKFSRKFLKTKGKRGRGMTLSLRMTATVSIVQSVRPGESSPKASESSDSEESKELMTIGTSNHYTSHSSGVTTTTVAVVNQVVATLGNYM